MRFIPNDELNTLFSKYRTGDIIDIGQGTQKSLILIVPASRIELVKESALVQNLKEDLYQLISRYTDEKITGPKDIYIAFESQENFIEKHQSSWYNMFR
jgi:septum formation topological specificity factor MinE